MSDAWRPALRILSIAIAAAILAFVLLTADLSAVWRALRTVDATSAAAVVLLNVPVLVLFTARSLLVLRSMGRSVPLSVLVPASIVGNVAGSLTPAGSGDLLRAAALQRTGSLTMEDALALVAYERLLSSFLLLLSTVACLALVSLPPGAGVAIALLCAALALSPWLLATLIRRLPSPSSIRSGNALAAAARYILGLVGQVWALFRDGRLLMSWAVLTLLSFAIIALQFSLVAQSLAEELSLPEAWVAFGGSGIAAVASLIPFGLGVADGSLAALLHQTGIGFERAAAIAVLVRAIITLPLVVTAFVAYLVLLRSPAASRPRPP